MNFTNNCKEKKEKSTNDSYEHQSGNPAIHQNKNGDDVIIIIMLRQNVLKCYILYVVMN